MTICHFQRSYASLKFAAETFRHIHLQNILFAVLPVGISNKGVRPPGQGLPNRDILYMLQLRNHTVKLCKPCFTDRPRRFCPTDYKRRYAPAVAPVCDEIDIFKCFFHYKILLYSIY